MQQARLTALFQLAPQVADVHPQRVRGRAEVVTPHALVDLRPRQYLPRIAHEELEQVELGARQLEAAVTSHHLTRRGIQRQVTEPECAVAGAGPSQQRTHASPQLLDRERLDEVVVR